jgi:hypothetical protein
MLEFVFKRFFAEFTTVGLGVGVVQAVWRFVFFYIV